MRLQVIVVIVILERCIAGHATVAALARQALQLVRVLTMLFGVGSSLWLIVRAQGEELVAIAALVPRLVHFLVIEVLE